MSWLGYLPFGLILVQLVFGHCVGVNPSARDFTSHLGLQLVSRDEEPGVFWVNIFCQAAFLSILMIADSVLK